MKKGVLENFTGKYLWFAKYIQRIYHNFSNSANCKKMISNRDVKLRTIKSTGA